MEPTTASFWLVPAAPERRELADCIKRLSQEHAAPSFAPHVTVFAQLQPSPLRDGSLEALLARAAHHLGPVRVESTGIGHSDQLFKALFLALTLDPALQELHGRLKAGFAAPDDYALQPHLSLLYKALSVEVREQLAACLEPPASFVCDRLVAVGPGPKGWADIAGWHELGSRVLTC